MTTTTTSYLYEYKILHLTDLHCDGICVMIEKYSHPVIALAHVGITMKSAIDGREVDSWNELRYVIAGKNGEPDISYKENPSYGGVKDYVGKDK